MEACRVYASAAADAIEEALGQVESDPFTAAKTLHDAWLMICRIPELSPGEKDPLAVVYEARRALVGAPGADCDLWAEGRHAERLRVLFFQLRGFASRRPRHREKVALGRNEAAELYARLRNGRVKESSARTIVSRDLADPKHRNERGQYYKSSLRELAKQHNEKELDRFERLKDPNKFL